MNKTDREENVDLRDALTHWKFAAWALAVVVACAVAFCVVVTRENKTLRERLERPAAKAKMSVTLCLTLEDVARMRREGWAMP